MSLNDIVNVSIVTQTQGVTAAGFGVPLVLSVNATWAERVRFYADAAAVLAEPDFDATDPENLAASAVYAQNPADTRSAIGRRALLPTMQYKLDVKTATAGATYGLTVGGDDCSVVGGTGTFASHDQIVNQLYAAIVSAPGYAAGGFTAAVVTSGGAGYHYVTLTAAVAGNWRAVVVGNPELLTLSLVHADPGIETDLGAIALEDNTWYGLVLPSGSKAEIKAAAHWVESNEKLFVAASPDSEIASLASTTDLGYAASHDARATVAADLENSAYARTAVIYCPDPSDMADAAWLGKCLPFDPGSETWKFKTLATVGATILTATERTNILNKKANLYETVAGVNITEEGWVAAGEFIDVVRFRDWLKARMQERVYARLVNLKKIPFTDAGIALIEAEVRGQLQDGIDAGGLAADPAPVVTVPKAANVSTANKTARLLPDVKFTATLAGAIHSLTISGTISV